MESEDKTVYNSEVCVFCVHRYECNQNKFKVFVLDDRVTMRCADYEFINKD